MTLKHTPGPWSAAGTEIVHNETGNHLATVVRYGVSVGECPYAGNMPRTNALLIAAAPELLSALRNARSWLAAYEDARGNCASSQSRLAVIDSAISKAIGE